MHEEPREKIQIFLLKNLNVLANKVSHLWTNENVLSFIEYTNALDENETLLLKASEILCTLAQYSNTFFLFAFNTSPDENKLFECLLENMIFHDNKDIAYNFCLLATSLLILHKNNYKKSNTFLVNLFNLTKNGLFSIIIECDKLISNSNNLPKHVKNLKVAFLQSEFFYNL